VPQNVTFGEQGGPFKSAVLPSARVGGAWAAAAAAVLALVVAL
jgi:hypothetical protein